LEVVISVSSGGLDQFIDPCSIRVKEGEQQPLIVNTARLTEFLLKEVGIDSPELQLHLNGSPRHGEICTGGICNSTIINNDILYKHDDSDTITDEISLVVYLSPGDVLLCNITCPVTIFPVNDQVFKLITQSPYLSVVQGQSHVITDQDLLTEDMDTPPENITYEIVSGPSQGNIQLIIDSSNKSDSVSKIRFTQADVNMGRVVYHHKGSLQPTSFYFRVWDGNFNPVYTVFNIHVLPLTLNVTSYAPLYLQQCSTVTVLTPAHITVNTNGQLHNVKYNVTRGPQFGAIYLGDSPATYFTQEDLASNKVLYMQTDMMAPGDTFQLATWLIDTDQKPTVDINIVIKPLIVVGNFNPVVGLKNRLTTHAIDASPLAKITSSNPIYEIIKKPRLGKLKKIIRISGEKKNAKEGEIMRFTHEEIKSGVIYYVIRKAVVPDEVQGMDDVFSAHVRGSIYQPARLDFKFTVHPEGSNVSTTSFGAFPLPPRLPGPKKPNGYDGGISVASPNIKKDYIVIVGVLAAVLILALVVIVTIRCRTVKKQPKDKGELPLPLPRPPDDLMPSSPRIKRSHGVNGSATGTLPHCKVIPLGPADSLPGSDIDINIRYPYGMSDEPSEDWSSYEASEATYSQRTGTHNPMLRRNQYWV